MSTTAELQPLPEAVLVAADLRRKAKELLLMAERLEASCPMPERKVKVEFKFDPRKKKGQGNEKDM